MSTVSIVATYYRYSRHHSYRHNANVTIIENAVLKRNNFITSIQNKNSINEFTFDMYSSNVHKNVLVNSKNYSIQNTTHQLMD